MADSVSSTRRSHFKILASIAILCTFTAGCSTPTTTVAERSDKHPAIKLDKKPSTPRWRPGGPGDTDGKPGEPNCPDCDGGGPVYHGSVRPSR